MNIAHNGSAQSFCLFTVYPSHTSRPNYGRPRSVSPPKRQLSPQFMSPSRRAEAARLVRQRIYSQPLYSSVPGANRGKPANRGRQQTHRDARVLRRQPQTPRYDPDYSYVDPEAVLKERGDVIRPFSQVSHFLSAFYVHTGYVCCL